MSPLRAALLVGALALAATGCGGSSKSTSSSTTTTHTQAATTTAIPSKLPNFKLLNSANCRQLTNLTQNFAQAMSGSTKNLAQSVKVVKEFAAKAPAAIRPDFQVLAAAYDKVATALQGVNLSGGKLPSLSTIAKLAQLSSQLDAAKLTAADQHIVAWSRANCLGTSG